MPGITTVVFDMDGVLCRYRIDRRLALLASWSGQRPDAILYVDDDATYVVGAREAGLSAHRADGAASVRTGLALHGLARG